ncbi:DNA-protecting protein DprA [Actinoallomurus purpureus]|uniref:DNA-processing protein DprA n=1 Tax=Actinoallomurus purpureus TaxID=478114 RepID=UPI002093FDA3|nr:DNA-processing protein DprA [Actinoallomurus purpureus]MCO6010572.1 DNA-protecting protein DprA [Actinoallomurus purpureus]
MADLQSLALALAAFETLRTPGKITNSLRVEGRQGLKRQWDLLDDVVKDKIREKIFSLAQQDISVTIFGDEDFPKSLIDRGRPAAPILFYQGDPQLFEEPGIGMCGSRAATELGLKAARACGEEVSARGLVVISGYAKGVDTETHLAALQTGGCTVIVLAEGFDHFRIKKVFADDFDRRRALVVSQFPPSQPWGAYNAMARNKVIFGLGRALVVIEAGERGGTLAAGQGALKIGRPVFVLEFGEGTPPGNRILLNQGGRSARSRTELGLAIDFALARHPDVQAELPI